MHPGRNDPCPCGSGRKYKKCCEAKALAPTVAAVSVEPAAARAKAVKDADRTLSELILKFARMRLGRDCLRAGLDAYTDASGDEIEEAELQIAVPWCMYRVPLEGRDETLAHLFRQERGRRLSSELRDVLDAQIRTWLSIWEVQRVDPGTGVHVSDLLTGDQRFVHEISGSRSMSARDTLLGWITDSGGISFFGALHPRGLKPSEADLAVRAMRRLCGARTRPVKPERLREFPVQLALIHTWRALVERRDARPAPYLTNTDGDELVLTVDYFDVRAADRATLIARLATLPGAHEPESGTDDPAESSIMITKSGNARDKSWDNTVVGRVMIKGSRLRVESNSTRRADALRDSVTTCLGGLARYRLREEQSQTELFRRAMELPDEPEARVHSPEEAALVKEFREKHMLAWLDEPIPVLGGLTPREAAAKSPRTKKSLELLLRDFEHEEAKLPEDERFDIGRIRAELGVPG